MVAMAALTSLGTTSPRNSRQQAMYLPWRGSHFTIWFAGSKQALVISVRSTLRAPSNLREAVIEDTICPISLLRLL